MIEEGTLHDDLPLKDSTSFDQSIIVNFMVDHEVFIVYGLTCFWVLLGLYF